MPNTPKEYTNETKEDFIIKPSLQKPSAYSQFAFKIDGDGQTLPTSSLVGTKDFWFGGDGSDGPLAILSGTTTIDLGSASLVTKNYSRITINGSASLAFTNPHTNGTIIVLRCAGDMIVTSSSGTAIDVSGMGSAGGGGGTSGGGAGGNGGGGGASASTAGGSGGSNNAVTNPGTAGNNYARWLNGNAITGGAGGASGVQATGGSTPSYLSSNVQYVIANAVPGSGGGGGTGTGTAAGGAGGAGGALLYIEVAGELNFTTGTIYAAGIAGTTPAGDGGGGGGGGGGTVIILYNRVRYNTGTITVSGGAAGGVGGRAGLAGGNGFSSVSKNLFL